MRHNDEPDGGTLLRRKMVVVKINFRWESRISWASANSADRKKYAQKDTELLAITHN